MGPKPSIGHILGVPRMLQQNDLLICQVLSSQVVLTSTTYCTKESKYHRMSVWLKCCTKRTLQAQSTGKRYICTSRVKDE